MCQQTSNIDKIACNTYGSIIRCNEQQKIQLVFNNILIYYHVKDFEVLTDYILDFDIESQKCCKHPENRLIFQLAKNSSMCLFTIKEFNALRQLISNSNEYFLFEKEIEESLKFLN